MAGGEPHEERLLATVGGAVIDGARVGLAGSWDGHAEAYGFAPDGSDRVRLVIAANGLGSLQVGNSAPLAQPLDPDVGYPPATDLPDSSGLWEGFLYPIHSVQISADRIQLGIDPNDVFAAWCALQTSYPLWQYQDTPDGAVQTAYGCVAHGLQFGFEPIAPPRRRRRRWRRLPFDRRRRRREHTHRLRKAEPLCSGERLSLHGDELCFTVDRGEHAVPQLSDRSRRQLGHHRRDLDGNVGPRRNAGRHPFAKAVVPRRRPANAVRRA